MIKLTFYGGAQEVTGSCFLLESAQTKILVDCGMWQGGAKDDEKNRAPFDFDPSEVAALFVTHAHLDHIGRVPFLVKNGFKGKIYSTAPTRELSEISLKDALGLLERSGKKETEEKTFFEQKDLDEALKLWSDFNYNQELKIGDFRITARDAGHILGSSIYEIVADGKKIVVTGDLGNPPTPLLRPTYDIKDADYLVMEGIYGNRRHEGKAERRLKLERTIEDTVKAGGVLMVPAFSLERTQELLFELNDLAENGRIPEAPIFVDSPLAIKMTEVYKKYEEYFNKEAEYLISSGDDIFKFPGLRFTLTSLESKSINEAPPPKIIIAGSGMSTGGRILHHERRYLQNPKNTLLTIGFQAAGSLGRRLQEGVKNITIFKEQIPVRAKIVSISGYSAHPDYDGLFRFAENSVDTLKKVFVAPGEPQAALFLVQRLRDYLGIRAAAPKYGDSFELK
ncbi:MAG: MBL fold metallo-hydrolase [Patescibacteria group bacterium]